VEEKEDQEGQGGRWEFTGLEAGAVTHAGLPFLLVLFSEHSLTALLSLWVTVLFGRM
jgi:hypothetical protein